MQQDIRFVNVVSEMIHSLTILATILIIVENSYPGNGSISGIVNNGTTNLPFARVRVQATQIFTLTDFSGKFTLQGITSLDTLVVTAWAEGYYNGETRAVAGDTGIVIVLHSLPGEDNPDYEWLSPDPDSTEELRCGNCHASVLMNQWRNNAHAHSATNPFFLAMYYGTDFNGNPDIGVGYKRDFEHTRGNCATCHIPGAAANNPWGIDPKEVTGASRHGVFCDFCHKIYRVKPSTGQGTTGVLSIELLRPPEGQQMFFGPYDDIHEPDAYLPLIRKSEFCAPCHTGKFWGIPAYNSFPEWQASPYPSMGIDCQTCHMFPDSVTTHFALPEKGGLERAPLTIPSHLQPGSRDPKILANSVSMKLDAVQVHDSIKVMVTIYNDKTGHHVPTGRPSRNMLLLLTAITSAGDTVDLIEGERVPHWGGVGKSSDGNYAGSPGKGFAKVLEDFDEISPAPSWRPTRILSDNRIVAFAADTSFYYFETPLEPQEITIFAKLNYRRFFKPWMDEKGFDIPDIEMESDSIKIMATPVFVEDRNISLPKSYWLGQNYPNPFNPNTVIKFRVNEPTHVLLKVYDTLGRAVLTIVDQEYPNGIHQVAFDASGLASGVYFYKIKMGNFRDVKKALFLK